MSTRRILSASEVCYAIVAAGGDPQSRDTLEREVRTRDVKPDTDSRISSLVRMGTQTARPN